METASQTPPLEEASACETLIEELRRKVREARSAEDFQQIEKAYRFAADLHLDQKRRSGEPYLVHPLSVANILADMRMDGVSIQAALLHDVIEDTSLTSADLRREFGEEVGRVVDGVTKIGKLDFHSAEDRQAETYRKMLLAMVSDIRVILVKLADRLHNMRTLGYLKPEAQARVARETLEIYAPVANRLGMGKMRGELEDLAFRYLEPEAYAVITQEIETRKHTNEETLLAIRQKVESELRREGIPARVEARVKRAYSVYQKLKRQRISVEQVYDLLALRILTDSLKNCYAALGVIHNEWHPIPGRIKDFIAIPRPNLYQSLHTSVIGPHGQPFEVQIRTEQMHRVAEEGIAAHWKYKEGKHGPAEDDQRIAWLRQLVEWQREMQDPGDFMSTLKVDLYPEEVYTFTPRGRVIVLPRDATPIDFAYAIHSDIGNTCVGAKVNGRIVTLRYALKNGDIVEILTQPNHQPSKDWLSIVKTSRARNKIRQVINSAARAQAVEIGQKYLEKEARRLGVHLAKISRQVFEEIAAEYGCSKMEDLYAALGYGKFSPRQILQKAVPGLAPAEAQLEKPAPVEGGAPPAGGSLRVSEEDLAIQVKGAGDLLIYRARCCNPIRGEAIIGYITRGKGIAVHSRNCPNVQSLLYEPERKIDVDWTRSASEAFPVKLIVHTADQPGLLNQLTSILSNENTNIRNLEARTDTESGDGAVIEMTVDVKDKKQLEKLINAMRRLSGVRDVERAS